MDTHLYSHSNNTQIHKKTIAAIATAMGAGGIGIVRLSGSKAYQIGCLLTHKNTLQPRYAHFAKIYDGKGQIIDEAVVIFYAAPHSFTGEDVLEIQGHGGAILPNLVLLRCFELGVVQAGAGEFSYRAFENNKMDLLQAEAISDAIMASSEAQARSAIRSLSGDFSRQITALSDKIVHIRLYVEAMIDFSDEEDVDFLADGEILRQIDELLAHLKDIIHLANQGALLQNGVSVVIAGRPNAGKSSLLNALAGTERAIVSDVAGTTRDMVSETLNLRGLTINLTDTAGIRQSNDKVEQIGISRAKTASQNADILILVHDLEQKENPISLAKQLFGEYDRNRLIIVGNKSDLLNNSPIGIINHNSVNVSCATQAGLQDLIDLLCDKVGYQPNDDGITARARHIDALKRAHNDISDAKTQLIYGAGELSAESLRLAHNALGEMTGKMSADDLLTKIFSNFCIGK